MAPSQENELLKRFNASAGDAATKRSIVEQALASPSQKASQEVLIAAAQDKEELSVRIKLVDGIEDSEEAKKQSIVFKGIIASCNTAVVLQGINRYVQSANIPRESRLNLACKYLQSGFSGGAISVLDNIAGDEFAAYILAEAIHLHPEVIRDGSGRENPSLAQRQAENHLFGAAFEIESALVKHTFRYKLAKERAEGLAVLRRLAERGSIEASVALVEDAMLQSESADTIEIKEQLESITTSNQTPDSDASQIEQVQHSYAIAQAKLLLATKFSDTTNKADAIVLLREAANMAHFPSIKVLRDTLRDDDNGDKKEAKFWDAVLKIYMMDHKRDNEGAAKSLREFKTPDADDFKAVAEWASPIGLIIHEKDQPMTYYLSDANSLSK